MVRLFCDLKLHMSTQVGGVIGIIIHTTASLSMKADPSKIADKEQIIFQFYTEAAKADERDTIRLTPTATICTSFFDSGDSKNPTTPSCI